MAATDLVDWPADQPLRLSGAPSALRAPVATRSTPEPAKPLPQASLIDLRDASGTALAARSVGMMRGQLRVRLDATTPPGRYEGGVELAGIARPIVIDVVETVDVVVRPAPAVIDLAQGLTQRVTMAVENRGNVAVTIDLAGDYPLGEEVPIFPERLEREDGDALDQLASLFARTLRRRVRRALREAGTIALAMPAGAVPVDPGATRTIAVDVTLPAGLSASGRYRAFIPIYTADLELVAVTATKQAPPQPRPRARKRGAST